VDSLHDATTIPSAAIQRGTPGTFVYVINSDHTVKVTPVKLGPSEGENIAVTDGLNPGDMVVVDGTDKLRDGSKVTLPGEKGGDNAGDKKDGDKSGHRHRGGQ